MPVPPTITRPLQFAALQFHVVTTYAGKHGWVIASFELEEDADDFAEFKRRYSDAATFEVKSA